MKKVLGININLSAVSWALADRAESDSETGALLRYASTFPHCSMKSSEYLWPKTKRLVKDERRSKSKLRVCA